MEKLKARKKEVEQRIGEMGVMGEDFGMMEECFEEMKLEK